MPRRRPGRPPRASRRITVRDYPDLVDAWLHGQRMTALAQRYAVHRTTIRHHLLQAIRRQPPEVLRSIQQRIWELMDLRAELWRRLKQCPEDDWLALALVRGITALTLAEHSLAQALPAQEEDEFRVAGKTPDQIHLEAAQRLMRLIREHGLDAGKPDPD